MSDIQTENELLKEKNKELFTLNALLRAHIKMHSDKWISDRELLEKSKKK